MRTRTALLLGLGVLAVALALSFDALEVLLPNAPTPRGVEQPTALPAAVLPWSNDPSPRREAAASSRPEDEALRSSSDAPEVAPSESVRVLLRYERDRPCPASRVAVRADAGGEWWVGTEPGEVVLRGHGLSAAAIAVSGHATVDLDLRNRHADVLTVALIAGRSLRCDVRDLEGRPLVGWPVLVACEDEGALQRHWSERTNDAGRVELGELGPARYAIHVLEWRDHFAATQRVDLSAPIGEVVLAVARRSLDSFVPVDVVDVPATGAADGLLRGLALEVQDGGESDLVAIHDDGKAFVVGVPGAARHVRVVRTFRDSDRIEPLDAQWHAVVVGATSGRVRAGR